MEHRTHKPLVGGSNPPSATTPIFLVVYDLQQKNSLLSLSLKRLRGILVTRRVGKLQKGATALAWNQDSVRTCLLAYSRNQFERRQ